MGVCNEIKTGYLKHIKGGMYEVPGNYKAIVAIEANGVSIHSFTMLPPKIVDFGCELPYDFECPKVTYTCVQPECQSCECS